MLSSYSYDDLLNELQRRNRNLHIKGPEEIILEAAQRRVLRGEEQITRLSVLIDEMRSKGFDVSVSERAMEILQSSVSVLHRNLLQEQERAVQSHRLSSL